MYTRPGQQADDEMARERRGEPHCADLSCRHIIWTHKFMEPNPKDRTCSITGCLCSEWKRA